MDGFNVIASRKALPGSTPLCFCSSPQHQTVAKYGPGIFVARCAVASCAIKVPDCDWRTVVTWWTTQGGQPPLAQNVQHLLSAVGCWMDGGGATCTVSILIAYMFIKCYASENVAAYNLYESAFNCMYGWGSIGRLAGWLAGCLTDSEVYI